MTKYIILFRAINVGGKNVLPMKTLVSLLEQQSFHQVSSYIQSGNVVFACEHDPTDVLKKVITDNFGFSPEIFVFNEAEWSIAMANNPFNKFEGKFEGKFVHCYFCHNAIEVNSDKLAKYIAPSENYAVKNNVFYLHAPEGIGRSKLIKNIEACLNQAATGRNLNTTNKIYSLLADFT